MKLGKRLLILSGIVLATCSPRNPTPVFPICYPTSMIYAGDGIVTTYAAGYTWDTNRRVTMISLTKDGTSNVTSRLSFTYGDNGNIVQITEVGGTDTADLTYTDKNQLETFSRDGNVIYAMTYNPSGQLIKVDYFDSGDPNSGGWGLNIVYTLEYPFASAKNPTRVLLDNHFYPGSSGWVDLEYDDKRKPFSDLHLDLVLDLFAGDEVFGLNNIIKQIRKDKQGAVISVTEFAYVYDPSGYPTKYGVTEEYLGVDISTWSYQYGYECK